MKVCIAEKPSVAREIANVLGAKTKRDGYFEGNGYAVTYTFGHLCTLYEPKDYKTYWKSWDLNNLPMLPEKFKTKVVSNSGIQKQFKIVKKLFDSATEIINCGDAGQEGELIQRWVLNQANYQGTVKRLWISSLTKEAIKEGFNQLKDASEFDHLYYAGFSRAIGDWLLGINATRLYTVKHGGYKQVLSIGRVQTPTLAMLVERYLEIQNFKPQPYWELQTLYRNVLFNCEEGRFLDQQKGETFAKKVKSSEFQISDIQKKDGKEYAPKLFDLTGLQVYCNTKFGFSADETLKIAQKLYEQKAITYPRVDTTYLPLDIYSKCKGILSHLKRYNPIINPLLGNKLRKSSKVFNDKKVTDHHAIIPTGVELSLNPAQQLVYNIICKRFIAIFYPDCKVSHSTVLGTVTDVSFKTTGKEIIDKGWRLVFEYNNSDKQKEKDVLPDFVIGEKGPHEPSFLEKETKPPKQYSEASLLRAMETAGKKVDDEEMRDLMKENGIGRPSTRANIIETLFKRKYIKRNKKQIIPTPTGIELINTINNELLKSAELTGRWEKQLKEIEKGHYSASQFITNMKAMVDQLVYEVRSDTSPVTIGASTQVQAKTAVSPKSIKTIINTTCPKCGKVQILKGKNAYGCSQFKQGCDFRLPFLIHHKKISENQYLRLLKKGSTVQLKGFKLDDNNVTGVLELSNDKKVIFKKINTPIKSIPDKIKCPKCSQGLIVKGTSAYGCSDFKKGCDYVISFKKIKALAKGKTLDKATVYHIISGHKS